MIPNQRWSCLRPGSATGPSELTSILTAADYP